MNLPESLPARLYLLAFDTDKGRLSGRSQLGLVLRAAALADLYLRGRLADEGGKVRATGTGPAGDPVLDAVLQEAADGSPRSWHRTVGRHQRRTVRAVRDQLDADGWLMVHHRPLLPDRVELREPHRVKQYAGTVKAALREPAARVDPRVAAVLALAANGEVRALLSRHERREHKERLAELADGIAPVADGLKRALRSQRAAMAGA
jgi:hypothetical protein